QRRGHPGQGPSRRPRADRRRGGLGRVRAGGDAASAAASSRARGAAGRRAAMTTMLRSYVQGRWVEGQGTLATLVNPATEEPLARTGVAVHINAFNFPAWGTAEKTAASLLAGMPIISKPATSTALVASRLAELGVETGALPPGSFTFLAGGPGDLLDRLGPQDVVAFTGSSQTAAKLREQLARRGARLNVEADSLNAAVLGPDVTPGSATWDLFVADVVRDIIQKAGQKCTAVRRIFAGPQLDAVQEALVERLSAVKV